MHVVCREGRTSRYHEVGKSCDCRLYKVWGLERSFERQVGLECDDGLWKRMGFKGGESAPD